MRSQTTTRLSRGCFQKSTVRIKTESGWTAAFLQDGRTLRSVLLAPSIRGVFCVSVYIKTRYVEAYKSKHFEDMKQNANSCYLRRWKFRRRKLQQSFCEILNVVNIGAFPIKLLCIKTKFLCSRFFFNIISMKYKYLTIFIATCT